MALGPLLAQRRDLRHGSAATTARESLSEHARSLYASIELEQILREAGTRKCRI